MVLQQVALPEPGRCVCTFAAGAGELRAALDAQRAGAAAQNAQPDEAGLMAAAINHAILAGFSPLYEQAVAGHGLTPITDPDFSLVSAGEDGFCARAEFFVLPPLTLRRYTGFVQPVQPRPIRQLTLELEINRRHGAEDRAADAAGKAALRSRVAAQLWQQRCAQARTLAGQAVVMQLGAEVQGALPADLVAGNYFAEQRRFNLSLQANNLNFDQYLAAQNQTVEQFRQELHAQAEQRLRGRLGLLLVAGLQGLWPDEAEVDAALARWQAQPGSQPTFAANDRRKQRQQLASQRAAGYVVAHSTLTPPPAQPVILPAQKA